MFSLISTNTSTTVTLAVDGLTPCPVKRSDGSALAVGSLRAGMFLDVVFTGAKRLALRQCPAGRDRICRLVSGVVLGLFRERPECGEHVR